MGMGMGMGGKRCMLCKDRGARCWSRWKECRDLQGGIMDYRNRMVSSLNNATTCIMLMLIQEKVYISYNRHIPCRTQKIQKSTHQKRSVPRVL